MITVCNQLRARDIDEIFEGKITALKIPGYFSAEDSRLAADWLLRHRESSNWKIGSANQVATDTNFLLGVPRRMAANSPEEARRYRQTQKTFLADLREAFRGETPLEKFLSEISPSIEPFEGGDGLPAIVRHMTPETLSAKDGACHFDSRDTDKLLSLNLYLSVPNPGGELDLWNWPVDDRQKKSALHRMISQHAFNPKYRDTIRKLLPDPERIAVEPGDLLIFDTSKVHAIRGFTRGHRISVQSFLKKEGQLLIISA